MNFSLKPHHLIAHWAPGFFVVFCMAWLSSFLLHIPIVALVATGPIFLMIVAGMIVGQVIDAMRISFIETLGWWNRRSGCINWDFFFRGKSKQLQNLDEFYYVYYEFDVNLLVGFVLILFLGSCAFLELLVSNGVSVTLHKIAHVSQGHWYTAIIATIFWAIAVITLFRDAINLRCEIAHLIPRPSFPHDGVLTRLKPSKIPNGGIGVYAIADIKKGTRIFGDDDADYVLRKAKELRELAPEIRKMYDDFCIIRKKGTVYKCPNNFNEITISWYLNHSCDPNVEIDSNEVFFASCDIKAGDELTVDYLTYNEWDIVPEYVGVRPTKKVD